MKKWKIKIIKINNKIMRQVFILLVMIVPILSFGQFNKFVTSDSLFKCYKLPIINSKVYNQLEKDDAIIYIGCYFTTDTTGKVTSQKFIPLNGIGNKYESSDSIWHSIINSLEESSKDWVFKTVLWQFKNDKKTEMALNKRAFQRPYNGRPRYFIIFEVSGIQGSIIQKISFENHFKVN